MTCIRAKKPPMVGRCSLGRLCRQVGISRQAHYQWLVREETTAVQRELILGKVREFRRYHGRMGGRKLYQRLCEEHADLMSGVGRDAFFLILQGAGLLVRPTKRTVRTTHSQRWRRQYRNLIRGVEARYPGHILVTDITYLRAATGFVYLALVTDLYSRKIIGYDVSSNLTLDGALRALRMALGQLPRGIATIHHSDNGVQYYGAVYREEIEQRWNGTMSMTEDGNVYENAVAERVNGILKQEYDLYRTVANKKVAERAVAEAIRLYNEERPHMSIGMATPAARFAGYREAA